mmetsp:Transcript_118451/g.329243  ORF Transcript_118451/g.329243 Transcript_118451/m.329243 type:complete len:124 (+) Transcript_118451:2-373(+)
MVGLLQQARELLKAGFKEPVPVNANLSPVGKVFKAYCYWAHRERLGGLEAAIKSRARLSDIKAETWLGNSFPEDFVNHGLPEHGDNARLDTCLLGALRASFDKTYPETGLDRTGGWFGTEGNI